MSRGVVEFGKIEDLDEGIGRENYVGDDHYFVDDYS